MGSGFTAWSLEVLSLLTCFLCSLAGVVVFVEAGIRKCTRMCCFFPCCCWIWFERSEAATPDRTFSRSNRFLPFRTISSLPHLVKGQNWILALFSWCTMLCRSQWEVKENQLSNNLEWTDQSVPLKYDLLTYGNTAIAKFKYLHFNLPTTVISFQWKR